MLCQKLEVMEDIAEGGRVLRGYREPAEGSIGSLDRNDEQPGSPV